MAYRVIHGHSNGWIN